VTDGTWLLAEGVGPIFVPDNATQPIQIRGSGRGGAEPQQGGQVDRADLTEIAALTNGPSGQVIVATQDRIFELGETLHHVAGSGSSTPTDTDQATEFALLDIQALELGSEGDLYVADAHPGLVFAVRSNGEIEVLAGGGDRLSVPVDAIPGDEAVLGLHGATMSWDADAQELIVATADRIVLIDPDARTIRSLAGVPRSLGGAAPFTQGYLVSRLDGSLRTIVEGESTTLIGAPEAEDSLAWGNAIESVGVDSLLVRDPARSVWSIHIRGFGLFPLIESGSATQPPSRLLVANDAAHVYYTTPADFRHLELNVGFRTLARSTPPPVFEGQTITQYMLPMIGELSTDKQGDLLIVDACRKLLLGVDPANGSLEQIAGVINGGVLPSATYQPLLSVARLENPSRALTADGYTMLVDHRSAGVALVVLNSSDEEQQVFGTPVTAGRAAVVGGLGDEAYEPGAQLSEVRLDAVTAAALVGEELVLATTVADEPALIVVDTNGVASDLFAASPHPPTALLTVTPTVLAVGYAESGQIDLLNLSDVEQAVLGTTALVGQLTTLADIGAGVRDLATVDTVPLALTVNGTVIGIDPAYGEVGQAGSGAYSLAESPGGGLLVLVDGGIWGFNLSSSGSFLEEALPNTLSELVTNTEGWIDGFPVTSLPFGDNITGLALNEDGALFFTDRDLQALIRVDTEDGMIGPLSPTTLVARGDPIPMVEGTVALQVDESGQVYMLSQERVYRFDGSSWDLVAGGGQAAPLLGASGTDLDLEGVAGMEWYQSHLYLRTAHGLLMLDSQGEVAGIWTSEAMTVPDPTLMRDAQGLAVVDGIPTFVLSGGVVELVDWP